MFGPAQKTFHQRLAGWAALGAMLLQALYAVPAAERMGLKPAFAPHDAVICLASGGSKIAADLPGKPKPNCSVCIAAALTALAAFVWLCVRLLDHQPIARGYAAPSLVPARLSRAHRSRGPPRLV